MLELETALNRILEAVRPLEHETVALTEAADRVLAEPILSAADLPRFDNSAMDGYAVRSPDLAAANPEKPASLLVRGKVAAGEVLADAVAAGTCVRVFTGSPLPAGADAVVMQEDTRPDPSRPDTIWVLDAVKPWANVRFRGEDAKCGTTLAEAGDRLTFGHVGWLAAAGLLELKVSRQPRVGLLATGNELAEAGQPLQPGQIYESNRAMLAHLVKRSGAQPDIFPLVPDTLEATHSALEKAFSRCDAVITTGGVSVGEFDFVKAAFEQMGGELNFWKVSIKPGKPFVFGCAGSKFLFGLPGNPVSALVTFLVLVRPALARMQGARDTGLSRCPGMLAGPLTNPANRRHFMRVFQDHAGNVRSAGAQASHLLGSIAKANGLVDVPPNTTFVAGTTVAVLRWDC
jgi:molybdopterin molybdotransferase